MRSLRHRARRIAASVAGVVIIALCGCSPSPRSFIFKLQRIQPELIDNSGAKLRHALIEVRFQTHSKGSDMTDHWDTAAIASDIGAAFEIQARQMSGGRLKISRVPKEELQAAERSHPLPEATHLIIVDVKLSTDTGRRYAEYSCRCPYTYPCEREHCSGGHYYTHTDTYLLIGLEVAHLTSDRTVYRASPQTMLGPASWENPESIPPPLADACLRALRLAGLF